MWQLNVDIYILQILIPLVDDLFAMFELLATFGLRGNLFLNIVHFNINLCLKLFTPVPKKELFKRSSAKINSQMKNLITSLIIVYTQAQTFKPSLGSEQPSARIKAPPSTAQAEIDKAIAVIQEQSAAYQDGLFRVDYSFLQWIEEQYYEVNSRIEHMPSELEMLWRDRINSSIKDDLFTLYRWVHPNVQPTALSYFQWLEKVYVWEQQHNTKH